MEQDRKRALLAGNYLFRGLSPVLLEQVAALSRIVRASKGSFIFHLDDEGNALYGVVGGLVRIWVSGADGREFTLSLMEPGDFFGEIALLDGLPRTANASALTDCELLRIDRPHFLELLDREPKLARHFIELLCERIRTETHRVIEDAFFSLKVRLAKRLHALMIAHGRDSGAGTRIDLRLSQSDLANMLGVTREAVNKQLSAWARRGLLEHGRGEVVVLDAEALRREAYPPEL